MAGVDVVVASPVSPEAAKFEALVGLCKAMVQIGPAVLVFLELWGPPDDPDLEPEPEDPGRG